MLLKRFLNLIKFKKSIGATTLDDSLIQILQFSPKNPLLFLEAFTTRSAQKINLNGHSINYERLEFLGDAMLGAVIAKYLYDEAPAEKEGYLTQMRSKIVSREHLNEIGKNLRLISYVDKDITESHSLSQHIEGDIFEALIGAIYQDQGFETTEQFIHRVVIDEYVNIKQMEHHISSYKSFVYEWVQKNKIPIEFNTIEENNAQQETIFVSTIKLNNRIAGKGRGSSKKKAEEKAAKRVYYANQKQM